MAGPLNAGTVPHGILYTMLRVSDLNASIAFCSDGLGMTELRRETFPEGRFTLVFMCYVDDAGGPSVEFTWTCDIDRYSRGTGYGHIAPAVRDIYGACARLAEMGAKITRDPAPMAQAPEETGLREEIAFLTDPDGYRIELIAHPECRRTA